MTHTDLSAEEPSERAATGPLLGASWSAEAIGPLGTGIKARGEFYAPAGSAIEIAVAIFIVLAGAVLLPAGAAAILATTDMPGWMIGVIATAVLVTYVVTAAIVVTRKGLRKP